jgi:hypothetical protein
MHSAAASIVDGILSVTVSTAENRHLGALDAENAHEVDRVAHDVGLLVQRGEDVDRGVRDEQRLVIGRHVHREDMRKAPFRAQTAGAARHGVQQLIGMQAALHQQFGAARAHGFHGGFGRSMAVSCIDDRGIAEGQAVLFRHLPDAPLGTNQQWSNQAKPRRFQCAIER